MQTLSNQISPPLQKMVVRIMQSGQMSRQEHLSLATLLLATQKITAEDRTQINRIFDYVQAGRLKLVD